METVIQRLNGDLPGGNELYIKRDDLLPFSMGGNKVRIAEAFFQDMREKGCDVMVVYGSRHSNLCRVLSNLCCSRGVDCVMICSNEDKEETASTNNTYLIEWAGAQVVHCPKSQIALTVERVMEDQMARGKRPYYIYGDKFGRGNEGTAAKAYAQAYQEIRTFEQEQGWEFDQIFCPSGTGATQSGLICGHLLAGDRKRILGVMISSRETQRAFDVIREGVKDYFLKAGKELPEQYEQEILLLDDGSKDQTVELARCLLEKSGIRWQIIQNQKNVGVARNFEQGIRKSQGDIVLTSDQDDVWTADKAEHFEKIFLENPNCVLAFSDAKVTDSNLQVLRESLWDASGFGQKQQQLFREQKYFSVLFSDNVVTGAAMGIRKRFAEMCIPAPAGTLHDYWFALCAPAYGSILAIAEKDLMYRQHGKNVVGIPGKGWTGKLKRRKIVQIGGYGLRCCTII